MSSIRWPSPRNLIPGFNAAASRRIRRWARKRQGKDPQTTVLRPGRVYILPTGVGMVYALMTFAMLLGSMNYNNNLSFLLTFLLIGLGFVAMHQCQRNLVGLEVSFAGTEPVFAGQVARFQVAVTNRARNPRQRIRLYTDKAQSDITDLRPGESRILTLPVRTSRRGWIVAGCRASSCSRPGWTRTASAGV